MKKASASRLRSSVLLLESVTPVADSVAVSRTPSTLSVKRTDKEEDGDEQTEKKKTVESPKSKTSSRCCSIL